MTRAGRGQGQDVVRTREAETNLRGSHGLEHRGTVDHAPSESVPFVDLGWIHGLLADQIDKAVAGVLSRSDFILGGAVADFEAAFADYCEAAHAIGVDSGYSALELALRGHDVGPGAEVITAANTFVATVGAIEACGATPVLVDIDPATFNLEPALVEGAITPATRAIIPVHLYGRPAPMSEIARIAADHDLVVIEDACQAHGARYEGRRVGGLGNTAAFSFYPTKNLGALGDGGAIVTDDDAVAARIRKLRNLGSTVKYQHEIKGFNRRLDTLHAAVLAAKLPHLDDHNEWRQDVAAIYAELLADAPVELPVPAPPGGHVYHLYVIQAPRREELQAHLAEHRVGTGIHYPIPIHLQPAYRSLGKPGSFPVTESTAERILSLPMYAGISRQGVERTASLIAGFYED